MRRSILPVLASAIGLVALTGASPPPSSADAARVRGEQIAQTHCARCHAIGTDGVSANPKAPPFRQIERKYPVEALAEAFAEGIVTGHKDMPEFVFEPDDVAALLTYLKSVQR